MIVERMLKYSNGMKERKQSTTSVKLTRKKYKQISKQRKKNEQV